jgi:hypothetical protein
MEDDERTKFLKLKWTNELKEIYPFAPVPFLELMIDCYFNNPKETEAIIEKHKNDEIKI